LEWTYKQSVMKVSFNWR